MAWEPAERVQKNDAGEYRAMIGGAWVPVAKAQKSESGEYRVERAAGEVVPSSDSPPERSIGQSVLRQLGLTARHGIEGVAGLAAIPSNAIDALTPASWPKFRSNEAVSGILDKVGLPRPEGATERFAGSVAQSMAGTGGLAAGAGRMAGAIPQMLSQNMGTQVLSAAGAGAGGGMAHEAGADPMTQFGASLLGAVAAPAGVGAARWGGGKLADISATVGASFGNQRGIDRLASDALTNAAGDSKGKVLAALMNKPTEYVPGAKPTAAEAIAEAQIGTPNQFGGGVVKLQQDLTGAKGIEDILPNVAKQQNAAMVDPLNRMAGGTTTAAQNQAQSMAAELRNNATAPMRDRALSYANEAGVKGPQIAKGLAEKLAEAEKSTQDVRRFAGAFQRSGDIEQRHFGAGSRVPEDVGGPVGGRYSYAAELGKKADEVAGAAADKSLQAGAEARFLDAQLKSLAAGGYEPLKSGAVTGPISRVLSTPGLRASDVVQKTLGAVREKIAALTNKNGVIDARDLYTIRKEIGNTIKTFAKESNNWDKRLTADLDSGVKGYIDNAIEQAGGRGWKEYLSTYADMSKGVDRLKVAQSLAEKLRNSKGNESAATFLTGIGRGEESMLQRSAGTPRDSTIETLFPAQDAQHIRGTEAQLLRQAEVGRIAGNVRGSNVNTLAESEVPHIPNLLSRPAMILNFALKGVSGGANTPVAKRIAEAATDPVEFAKLLRRNDQTGITAREVAKRAAMAAAIQQNQGAQQ